MNVAVMGLVRVIHVGDMQHHLAQRHIYVLGDSSETTRCVIPSTVITPKLDIWNPWKRQQSKRQAGAINISSRDIALIDAA